MRQNKSPLGTEITKQWIRRGQLPQDITTLKLNDMLGQQDRELNPQHSEMKQYVTAIRDMLPRTTERSEHNKAQVVMVNEDEFDALNDGKVDFALDIECGSCVPVKGDTVIFMLPEDEQIEEPAAHVAVTVTYAEKVKAMDLPANLFKEWVVDHVGYGFDTEVLHLVFEMDAEATLMANGAD